MGLHIPVVATAIAELSAEEVWAYATRILTSLQDPTHLQKYLGGPAGNLGTVLPAGKSLYDAIALDRLDDGTHGLSALQTLLAAIPTTPELEASAAARYALLAAAVAAIPTNPALASVLNIMEHEIGFSSAEVLDNIAAAGDQNTTERTITVALPSGATIRRVSLLALVTVMNNTATAHKIDVTVQGRKGAGGWNNYFDEDDCVGFGAVDGATTILTAVQDVTALVDAAASYGFRLTVNQSGGANSVHYTTQYILLVTYRMS